MNKTALIPLAVAALAAGGVTAAVRLTGTDANTVTACATTTAATHTVAVDTNTTTLGGETLAVCATATAATETVTTSPPTTTEPPPTGTTTAPPDTVTAPPTTTTAPPPTASLFVAPTGSDSNPCTQLKPCKTFDRAYKTATPGKVVEIAAGTYPQQNVNPDASKTSPDDVVFRPAAGATVTVADMNVHGSHLTFQDFTIQGGDWTTFHETDDVTFLNVNVVNGGIYTQSSSNISVIGGSIGPLVDTKPQIGVWPVDTANRNILIDGVTFHDMTRTSSSVHTECLLIGGAVGLTVRNSTFHNCAVFDLSIGAMNGTNSSDVTVQNNTFEPTIDGFFSLFLNDEPGEIHNILIDSNTAGQEMYFSYGTPTLTNFVVSNNTGPMKQTACDNRITYTHNDWTGAQCGPTDY